MCSFVFVFSLSCRLAGCYGCSPTQTTILYRSSSRSGVLWGFYHSGYRNWCIFYLLVCGQVDAYCCVLLFVPFGPWLYNKGCTNLKTYSHQRTRILQFSYMALLRVGIRSGLTGCPRCCRRSCCATLLLPLLPPPWPSLSDTAVVLPPPRVPPCTPSSPPALPPLPPP